MKNKDYVSNWARLIIRGADIDFEKISQILGLLPTKAIKKGEQRIKGLPSSLCDEWIYESNIDKNLSISDHLETLKIILSHSQDKLRELSNEFEVAVRCSFVTDLAQGEFSINPETLKFFCEANVLLEVSIFSWGGVLD